MLKNNQDENIMKYHAAIFDMDGLLLDTEKSLYESFPANLH